VKRLKGRERRKERRMREGEENRGRKVLYEGKVAPQGPHSDFQKSAPVSDPMMLLT